MACKAAAAAPTKPTFSSLPLATLSALRCLAFPRFSPLRPSLAALTPSWVSFSSSVHLGVERGRALHSGLASEACHAVLREEGMKAPVVLADALGLRGADGVAWPAYTSGFILSDAPYDIIFCVDNPEMECNKARPNGPAAPKWPYGAVWTQRAPNTND